MRMRAKFVAVNHASAVGVAERWEAQYGNDWRRTVNGDSKEIYDKLAALGPNPDIAAVAKIIGNKSWSYISCSGCPDYAEKAVAIGNDEPRNYCETCIREAFSILTEK